MKTTKVNERLDYSAQDENFVLDESILVIPDKSKFKKVPVWEWVEHITTIIEDPSYVTVDWQIGRLLMQFINGEVSSFIECDTNSLANHYIAAK
jgi:hypothetical protein